jgi:alpha-tubulin suppressor-like RCC1 family protein
MQYTLLLLAVFVHLQLATAHVKSTVSSGLGFTACFVESDGIAYCQGRGTSGQLGNSASSNSGIPEQVSGITTATDVCAGLSFSCFLLADETVKCTGVNWYGQLGDNQVVTGPVNVPQVVPGLSSVSKVGFLCFCGGVKGNRGAT